MALGSQKLYGPTPQEEVNANLNGEGVIIHSNNLLHGEIPQLLFGTVSGKPPTENPSVEQIRDAFHGSLSLLLHGAVIIRRHKDSSGVLAAVEEVVLDDEGEEPVAVDDVVSVEELAHVTRVEGELVGEFRGGVVEAAVGAERGGREKDGVAEVVGEDGGATGDAVVVHDGGGCGIVASDQMLVNDDKYMNVSMATPDSD